MGYVPGFGVSLSHIGDPMVCVTRPRLLPTLGLHRSPVPCVWGSETAGVIPCLEEKGGVWLDTPLLGCGLQPEGMETAFYNVLQKIPLKSAAVH